MATIKIEDIELNLSRLEMVAVRGGDNPPGSKPPWDRWYRDRPPITW